ncbi:MAG: S26 family signal peptidase [Thermoplasmata archaeon]
MEREEGSKLPKGVINLLRDLAVAFLLVAIVMASLFAFTRVWPPMVVVESSSMQHSNEESSVGVIDTGDIVLVQNAPRRQDVVSYVEGRAQGYSTYGDYGDVIIFRKFGREDFTPVIHRAIMFLAWNETAEGFDIPSLLALERGVDWDSNKAEPFGLGRGDQVVLKEITFKSLDIVFRFDSFVTFAKSNACPSPCSGYITMGDNNAAGNGGYDSWIVKEEWILGRARGEIPWFGLLKLVLNGGFAWGDGRAPANSWTFLAIAIILLVVGPLAVDILFSFVISRRSR